jgi:mono/diheme cytochrome c family protein
MPAVYFLRDSIRQHRPWYALPLGITMLSLLLLVACADAPVRSPTPARSSPPPDVQANAGHGRYIAVGCAACHGEKGEGGIGPRISGLTTPLPDVEAMMRTDRPHGVKYDDDELTNQDVVNIYLWLRTNPAGDIATP